MNPVLLELKGEAPQFKMRKKEISFESVVSSLLFFIKALDECQVLNGEYEGEAFKAAANKKLREALGKKGKFSRLVSEAYNGLSDEELERINLSENNGDNITIYPFGIVRILLENENLSACHLSFNGKTGLYEKDSFMLLYVIEGSCLLTDYDSSTRLASGSAVFIPADFRTEITGGGNVIIVHS